MTWTPSTPSLPPGSGRPTPTSARSTGSSPPPTPESSSATYTQTLRGDGLLEQCGPPDRTRPEGILRWRGVASSHLCGPLRGPLGATRPLPSVRLRLPGRLFEVHGPVAQTVRAHP